MSKKTAYSKLLKDSRWIELSQKIRERDSFKCLLCDSDDSLNVHHKRYIKGKKPWESPESDLITLCNDCHRKVHQLDDKVVFVGNNIKGNRKVNDVNKFAYFMKCIKKYKRDFKKKPQKVKYRLIGQGELITVYDTGTVVSSKGKGYAIALVKEFYSF